MALGQLDTLSMNTTISAKTTTRATARDMVFIDRLEVETIIGIFDWERNTKQVVCLDIEMQADITHAALYDDINATLNYKAVAERLTSFIQKTQFQLVETLAQRCAEIILNEFQVPWLRLKLYKPDAVPDSRAVGVIIERSAPLANPAKQG